MRHIVLGSALVGGAACIAAAVYLFWKKRGAVTEFTLIGRVSALTLYPVKSMKGLNVEKMECDELGGKFKERRDRHFMVMDGKTGKLVSARQFPKLVTILNDFLDGTLYLSSEGRYIQLNIEEVIKRRDVRKADLFGLKQEGLDCGDEIGNFLRECLGTEDDLRMLYYVKNLYTERDVVPQKEWLLSPVPERLDPVAFPDECPYMAICDASLEDLNSRLPPDQQVDMRCFRPIIQVSDAPPYDEDNWAELKIADVVFSCYKPCTRCVVTTVDPDTGIRRPNNQPLKLLREYRLAPGKLREVYRQSPVFGVNMGIIEKGTIRLGDPVYARYKAHPF